MGAICAKAFPGKKIETRMTNSLVVISPPPSASRDEPRSGGRCSGLQDQGFAASVDAAEQVSPPSRPHKSCRRQQDRYCHNPACHDTGGCKARAALQVDVLAYAQVETRSHLFGVRDWAVGRGV